MKNESEVAQSYPTLSDPMDWSLPGSSVHGIFQARVLEWGANVRAILHVPKGLRWKIGSSYPLDTSATPPSRKSKMCPDTHKSLLGGLLLP